MNEQRISIDKNGVYVNGIEIFRCTSVDVKNISPDGSAEVTLRFEVNKADIKWSARQTE